jgi:hypothetical protein
VSPSKDRAAVRKSCEALEAELGRLRVLVREVGEAYITNLEAEVVQIQSDLASVAGDLRTDEPVVRMIEEIRTLRVKPGKGRMKDVKRMDALIDRLEGILRDVE